MAAQPPKPVLNSNAHQKFTAVVERCEGLCDLHEKDLSSHGVVRMDSDDLVRSALALSIAAMDAYFRDHFIECLIPHVKRRKSVKLLAQMLREAGVDFEDVLELLDSERPHRTLRNKVAEWLLREPMHDLERVDALYEGLGLKDLTRHASAKAGTGQHRSRVVQMIERRHQIVHYGDYYQGKRKVQKIERPAVLRQMKSLRRLVLEADAIITSACPVPKRAAQKKETGVPASAPEFVA